MIEQLAQNSILELATEAPLVTSFLVAGITGSLAYLGAKYKKSIRHEGLSYPISESQARQFGRWTGIAFGIMTAAYLLTWF